MANLPWYSIITGKICGSVANNPGKYAVKVGIFCIFSKKIRGKTKKIVLFPLSGLFLTLK